MENRSCKDGSRETLEHNYGIDALRMLSMFMVVVAHILGRGGILEAAKPLSGQYKIAWFLEMASYCSVNCYALISGYVGIYAKYKYQNIILLWLRVIFYTVTITLLFSIFVPDVVSLKDWIKAIFPVTSGYYWYVTAYFALFFFMPILNFAANMMTKSQYKAVVVMLVLVFSFWPTLFHKEVFGTSSNAWWLIILYIIGGYIRKYGVLRGSNPCLMFLGYLFTTALTWQSKLMIESPKLIFLKHMDENYLFNNTSITMLLSGIFLLLMFERIPIDKGTMKIVKSFSPAAFSVYLIHAHPFVWRHLLTGRFAYQASLPVFSEILSILFTAAAIYVSCSFIDLVRAGIFKRLQIQQRIGEVERKYLKNLWN